MANVQGSLQLFWMYVVLFVLWAYVDTNADIATSVSSDVKDSSVHEKQVQDIEKGGKSVEQGEKAASA